MVGAMRRLFVSPHLPRLWVRLRRRQLQARERREVLDNGEPVQLQEQQQQLKEDAAVAARKERELPPLAVRGKQLGKRVAGNAARSSISLVATAAGTAHTLPTSRLRPLHAVLLPPCCCLLQLGVGWTA